jgi:hypothetical protein
MIDLSNSVSIDQLESLLKFSNIFLEQTLKEDNVLDKWKDPKFKSELIELMGEIPIWRSNDIDLIELEIVEGDDYSENHDYVNIDARNFLMFIALGSKGILEYIERDEELVGTFDPNLSEDLFLYKKIFDEIQSNIEGNEYQFTNPLIYFHLTSNEEKDFFNDDYY